MAFVLTWPLACHYSVKVGHNRDDVDSRRKVGKECFLYFQVVEKIRSLTTNSYEEFVHQGLRLGFLTGRSSLQIGSGLRDFHPLGLFPSVLGFIFFAVLCVFEEELLFCYAGMMS